MFDCKEMLLAGSDARTLAKVLAIYVALFAGFLVLALRTSRRGGR